MELIKKSLMGQLFALTFLALVASSDAGGE